MEPTLRPLFISIFTTDSAVEFTSNVALIKYDPSGKRVVETEFEFRSSANQTPLIVTDGTTEYEVPAALKTIFC